MRQGLLTILLIITAHPPLLSQQAPDFRPNAQQLIRAQGDMRFDEIERAWQSLRADLDARVTPLSGREPDRAAAEILARRRADVKNGASSGAAGSTSSVLNPLLPAAFGFAFENGSLLRTISGNTMTISINPAGLLCATRADVVAVAQRQPGCAYDGWRKVGITASFDTDRGDKPASAADLRALSDQFAQATLRYEIINERKPGSRRFDASIADWKKTATAAANSANLLEIRLRPLHDELEKRLVAELDSSTFSALPMSRREDELIAIIEDVRRRLPTEDTVVREAASQWNTLLEASNRVYNSFAHGLVVTAEYEFQRPDVASEAIDPIIPQGTRPPNLHTARVVVARGLSAYNIDFTLNVSSSWFQQRLFGMTSSWRDFQVAGDMKLRLRDIPDFGTPTLSLAGLWMHLHQRPLGIEIPTFVGPDLNEPGNIGVFQAKFELPTANAAMRIPISFTYSNRTDLIKESDVRGQIGLSFNLDSLFANPEKK